MGEIHFAPPKKPRIADSLVKTEQTIQTVSAMAFQRWHETNFVHPRGWDRPLLPSARILIVARLLLVGQLIQQALHIRVRLRTQMLVGQQQQGLFRNLRGLLPFGEDPWKKNIQ